MKLISTLALATLAVSLALPRNGGPATVSGDVVVEIGAAEPRSNTLFTQVVVHNIVDIAGHLFLCKGSAFPPHAPALVFDPEQTTVMTTEYPQVEAYHINFGARSHHPAVTGNPALFANYFVDVQGNTRQVLHLGQPMEVASRLATTGNIILVDNGKIVKTLQGPFAINAGDEISTLCVDMHGNRWEVSIIGDY